DKSGQLPTLHVSYDRQSSIAGNPILEEDGTRYSVPDQTKRLPEYVGQNKWKFNMLFDTQNISVTPPRGKDGKLAPTADATPVRMSFKVVAPSTSSSAEVLKQVKVKLTLPLAAPKFDLSGLKAQSLELTPGMKTTLIFTVESLHPRSSTKVNVQNISTLKGSPSITCKLAKNSKTRQECTLLWSVPCDATDADVTQNIDMSAVATIDGKDTDVTSYTLKTSRSPKAPVACKKPGA
ncbi:MAG: hypothetical protein ACAH59_11535, partial [Pseudobdellovibrionaceae bacterium]